MRHGSLLTLALGASLAGFWQAAVLGQEPACEASAKPANLDFVLKDMNGRDVNLGDYRGQVILLDFWATWCAPCRVEIPNFIELLDEYGPRGFVVLGISVDDPVSALQSFAAELKIDYPVLVGADRDDVMDAYGPPVGFPTSFIIDRAGKICASHTGFASKEQFEQDIVPLL
jgi:cytochrome c biogenesis protein CcmG/thiol:disulfide interchange protein DsbE